MALQRAYEQVRDGDVSLRDLAALLRVAREYQHDEALAERDNALAQAEMFRRGMETALWTARKYFERIDPAQWRSFMDDVRRESEKFAGPDPRR